MNDQVKSALRVLDLLELFSVTSEPLGVSEVAKRLEIPKSSAQSLLQTLAGRGYLSRHGATYLLPGELRGGWVGGPRARLLRTAAPLLQLMADESGESAFLGMLTGGGKIQYVAKAVSPNDIRYDASLEHLRPIHCTSVGLIIMAYSPDRDVARWLQPSKLSAVTKRTITDPEGVRKLVAEARKNGFAQIRDANVEGAAGVSAPVFGAAGEVVAALNLGAPTWRYEESRKRLIGIVCREAQALTNALRAPAGTTLDA
jgi:IclR family transcriptional regulator, pca regulon regulatory protein